jgi:CheY-like chemotaxis protein
MPVMDGYGFLKAYRARPAPHASVLALTAAQYSAAHGPPIDAEAFLNKPFSLDELIEVVRRLARV